MIMESKQFFGLYFSFFSYNFKLRDLILLSSGLQLTRKNQKVMVQ